MAIEQEQYSLLYIQDMMCVLSRSQDICTCITRHMSTQVYIFSFLILIIIPCHVFRILCDVCERRFI